MFTASSQPQSAFNSSSSGGTAALRKTDTFDAFDAKFEQLAEAGGGNANNAFGLPPTITTTNSDSGLFKFYAFFA